MCLRRLTYNAAGKAFQGNGAGTSTFTSDVFRIDFSTDDDGQALGYNSEQLTYLVSTDIFMCGVATFLQLQLNKYFGIGLPVVLGVAFQSVAPLTIIGQSHGSGAMFGALIVSGIFVVLISGIFSKLQNYFPALLPAL